jgi:hypothetical protein
MPLARRRWEGQNRLQSTVFKEENMSSVARITTISARSETSFDDAVAVGVARASETLRNVSGAWIKDQKVEVKDGRIVEWQVALEVTFVLE